MTFRRLKNILLALLLGPLHTGCSDSPQWSGANGNQLGKSGGAGSNRSISRNLLKADLTYSDFVEPLMQNYCASCHSIETLDVFPALETYLDLEREAEVSLKTMKGQINPMPPSQPLDTRLTERFEEWIQAGLPE